MQQLVYVVSTHALDCKDSERVALLQGLSVLAANGRISDPTGAADHLGGPAFLGLKCHLAILDDLCIGTCYTHCHTCTTSWYGETPSSGGTGIALFS